MSPMIPDWIKTETQWCVSKNKMPLDMFALESGYEWGASDKRSHSSYVDYTKASAVRTSTGYPITFRMDSRKYPLYVVDIEKICPMEIRQAILLALHDHVLHLERSLSGKGYHLLIKLDTVHDFPTCKYKKWFEILSDHHCTFTENDVDFQTAYFEEFDTNEYITDDDHDVELLEALKTPISGEDFYALIGSSKPRLISDTSDSLEEYKRVAATFDGRHADLFGLLCDLEYTKTVDKDFHGDYSSYEFGYASKLHFALRRLASDMIDADCKHYVLDVSREQAIMLVYMVLKQSLSPRSKHSEFRNGLPWLLYTSQQVYVKTFDLKEDSK